MADPIASADNGQSVFDALHPPAQNLIDTCVHCGWCLPTCPTYALWQEEMDSPRGRIYMMKMGLQGQSRWTEAFVEHFDRCLGCMACETVCPSGVQYGKLIEATRSQVERNTQRPLGERLLRRFIFSVFPHPGRLRALAAPLWFYQHLGIRWILHHAGLLKLLPRSIRSMETLLPPITWDGIRSQWPGVIPAQGEKRLRVGLLLGCVQRVFFPEVNRATARVLSAEGCEVVVPEGQRCCGALMVHAGEEEEALVRARRMIDLFEAAGVDVIAINAAGCGSTMKEYGYLLRDDPRYAVRAEAFSAKCKDISEILVDLHPRAKRNPISMRVAYHDACHLQHAQRITKLPRELLRAIPGIEIVDIAESALCCGSAGIYNLVEAATARELGDRKVQQVLATGADAVVSGNPGCLLQISTGLERAGKKMRVLHLVELLDASIRGKK
ncbi:MAG: glycolate oxidase subunit GlcF [Acidobacteriia bacterium]|nr:glycolate oxidase subunit GlcF [Terriglobia bacterium]